MSRADRLFSIPQAARRLGKGPRHLLQEMIAMGGVQRTQFGYQATQEWVSEGLAVTKERQRWHPHFQQYRHTTTVAVTDAGIEHLQLFISRQ